MLELLEQQTKLTTNQRKIVAAAILGDMLDFFDFYLIGFVLAFIVCRRKLEMSHGVQSRNVTPIGRVSRSAAQGMGGPEPRAAPPAVAS